MGSFHKKKKKKTGIATTGSIHGVGVCVLAAAVKHSKTRCYPLSVCARVTEGVGVLFFVFFMFHVKELIAFLIRNHLPLPTFRLSFYA